MARGQGLPWSVLPDLRARLRRLCLVLCALAAVWTTVVVLSGGFVVDLGVVRLRSRTPQNPAIVAAIGALLAWVLVYIVVLHRSIAADAHSAFIAFRRLADSYYFDKRLVHPPGSWHGVSEIGMASLGIGVPLLVLAMLRTRSRLERHAALMYALPGLLFLIFYSVFHFRRASTARPTASDATAAV